MRMNQALRVSLKSFGNARSVSVSDMPFKKILGCSPFASFHTHIRTLESENKDRLGWQSVDLSSKHYWHEYYTKYSTADSTSSKYTSTVTSTKAPKEKSKQTTEWFCTSEDVVRAVVPRIEDLLAAREGDAKLLELGCGMSQLSVLLQKRFPKVQVIAVDSSEVAITTMASRAPTCSGIIPRYEVLDILNMSPMFGPASVDVVIDKGTMDALVHGDLYHHKHEFTDPKSLTSRLVHELVRILRRGGMYVQISDEAPELRTDLLMHQFARDLGTDRASVSFSELELENALPRYMYTVRINDN
eukprot:CFRG1708T1